MECGMGRLVFQHHGRVLGPPLPGSTVVHPHFVPLLVAGITAAGITMAPITVAMISRLCDTPAAVPAPAPAPTPVPPSNDVL